MSQSTCYFCHAKEFERLSDRIRGNEQIPVLRCKDCGLIFLDKTDPNFAIESYESTDYLNKHPQLYGAQNLADYDRARIETYRQKAAMALTWLSPEAEVLDIGCGCGSFLSLIQPKVKKATGVELNAELANYARAKLGIEIHSQPIETLDFDRKFDAIFMMQVVDHLSDPIAVLQKAKTYLKDGGFIWAELPNTAEALMNFLPEKTLLTHRLFHWHRGHLWYFNSDTVKKLFSLAGLRCEVLNMHDWTLLNFLQWWYLGQPMPGIELSQMGVELYAKPENQYMLDMNEFFKKNDVDFRAILTKHGLGSTFLCKATL
ncbi:MAG: class I SAM-dependent methyltransferase [Parcubacteria group bacterium]